MAGSFVQNHTTGTSTTGTAVTATLAANVAAGNLLACWVAMDNTGTATPTVSSIDKPGGETATWARVAQHDSSTATSAGGVRGELWVIKTTVLWASGTVITATLSASPPKSHMLCEEHTGVLATLRGTAGTSTSTTGAVSAATSGTALVAGDLVIGGATFETSATPTGDADTTNGSWSAAHTGNTGGGASAAQVSSIMQYKYVTATGVQTYNPTAGSADSGAAVAALQWDAGLTTPATIAAVAALPAPTVTSGWTAQPAAIAAVAAVGAPTFPGGGGGTVAPVGATTDFWKMETSTTAGGAGTNPWAAVDRASNTNIVLQNGDLLWAVVSWNANEAPNMASPAGWTVVTGWPKKQPATTSLVGQVLAYRLVTDTATEPATYTWQPKATDGTTNQAARGNVGIRVYRGADTTTPLDVTPGATQDDNSLPDVSTFTVVGITTQTANAYVIHGVSIEASSAATTITHPTGTTKIWDLVGRRQALAEEGTQAAAGASGDASWTLSAVALNFIGYQAALRPGAGGGGALATPTALAGVVAIPAPTVTVGVLVAAAAVATVASVGVPTVTVGALAAPAALAGVAAMPAPSVGGSAAVSPATIAGVASFPAATVTAAATVSPATIAAVAGMAAVTVTRGEARQPATLAGVAAVPLPSVGTTQNATAQPATIAALATFEQPARLFEYPSTTGTITGLQPSTRYLVTVRAYDAAGNRSADATEIELVTTAPGTTVTPATIVGVASMPAPSVTAGGGATTTPATITTVAAVGAPTVTVSTSRQPATITAAAGVGAPTVTVATTRSPATIVGVAALPAPSVGGSASISPTTITATVAVGAPTVQVDTSRQPATITTVAAVGAPTVTVGGARTPATISGVAAVGAPSVGGGGGAQPATITATAAVGAPTVTGGQSATVTPARILTVAAIGAVIAGAGAAATPATITVAAAIGAATVKYGATVAAATIVAVAAFPPIGPMVPPPRWVEHASVASGIVEGAAVATGIVEGSSSL